MDNGRVPIGKRQIGDSAVVACVVFETRDPEHLLQLLGEALTGIADSAPEDPATTPKLSHHTDPDPWLKHPEAAEYLGIHTRRTVINRESESTRPNELTHEPR
jgi:hypothetical protein